MPYVVKDAPLLLKLAEKGKCIYAVQVRETQKKKKKYRSIRWKQVELHILYPYRIYFIQGRVKY